MKNFFKWIGGIAGVAAAAVLTFLGLRETQIVTEETNADTVQVTTLYGVNGLVKFNKAGLSDSNFIRAIDSMGIDLFRYPGGTNANYDNWKTDSPSLRSLQLLVQRTGVRIVFDLNILTSTLIEQLAMLDSANKLGIDVEYIELGNELNIFYYTGKARFPNAQAYADTCKRWIDSISNHFPDAQFGVVGENKGWKGAETWSDVQLKTNPGVHLIWHFYADGKFTHNGIFDSTAFKALIHSDFSNSFSPGITANKVWITEFNLTDKDPKNLDTLNTDQIGVAVKFAFKEFNAMGIPVVLKHNVVSGSDLNYPAVYADRHRAYLMPAGRAIREFITDKTSDKNPDKKGRVSVQSFDSSILSRQIIGIYPAYIQQSFGLHVGRRVVSSFYGVRIKTPYTDTILLNIDNNSYTHSYTTDTATFAANVVRIYNGLKPALVVIENEELLNGDIKTYCNELRASCEGLPGKVTNGGLTLSELSSWYWSRTHDTAFFIHNIFRKQELLSGQFQSVINNVQYEIDVLKSLNVAAINVHFYIGYVGQDSGLIRMLTYLKNYTGKNLISNEAGMNAIGLLPDVVSIARQTGMSYLILYSGGSGSAKPISKAEFENAIR